MCSAKKKILLLGGSGYIGSKIHNYYKDKWAYDVKNISTSDLDLRLYKSVDKLSSLYDETTTIIFLAAVKRQRSDSLNSFSDNLLIATNICHSLLKKKVGYLIYLSSSAVYGEKNEQENYDENAILAPTSYYGLSKLSIENILTFAKSQGHIQKLCILRPTTIYGDIHAPTYCPSGLLGQAMNDKVITLWGDGQELRDFFNIELVVEVISTLVESQKEIILNLVTGDSVSFNEISRTINSYIPDLVVLHKTRSYPVVNHTYNNRLLKDNFDLDITSTVKWIDSYFR